MVLEDHREEEAEDSIVVRTVGANRKQDVQTGDSDVMRTVGANRKQDVQTGDSDVMRTVGANRKQDVQTGDSDVLRTVGANRKQDVQTGDRICSSSEKIIVTLVCILNHSCVFLLLLLFCFFVLFLELLITQHTGTISVQRITDNT